MTRLINNNLLNPNGSKYTGHINTRAGNPAGRLAMAILVLCSLVTGAALAQNSSGAERYPAEKTVNDYMTGDQSAKFDYASNSLRVEVWVDKAQGEIYRKGEGLGVGFEANQDAYAVVYRIDTEGLVTVLWPRSRFDDGFIFGGHEYQVPVSGARKLRVATAEGEGLIEAVVSKYPFDLRAIELDFHHEHTADRYNFRVAGDPFLAMNEVNYAVTGLEDSGEYVVTNYASYYVHQKVDHPRYLCNQCHVENEVAYDPYRDECTLDIEYDYSWYNGWYDNYGYYPVYGNPVYVYVDPWNHNPWVNYWYRPSYVCAPWSGWGWGWSACYSWNYSPYYYGDCVTAYNGGYNYYRPLDRTRITGPRAVTTKTQEYARGSSMVRKSSMSTGERGAMVSRTRSVDGSRSRSSVVGDARGSDLTYRGASAQARTRTSYSNVAATGRGQSGLRIREAGRTATAGRGGDTATRKRHTSSGDGRSGALAPVNNPSPGERNWRGTTRVGGASSGNRGSSGSTPTTVGNSGAVGDRGNQTTGRASDSKARVESGRTRNSSTTTKSVQQRKRSTRVWNSSGTTTGSSRNDRSTSTRARRETVNKRSNSNTSSKSRRETVAPRKSTNTSKSRSSSTRSSSKSSSSVKQNTGSRSSSPVKSSGSSGSSRSSSGSSRGKSSSSSKSSGSRSGDSRR